MGFGVDITGVYSVLLNVALPKKKKKKKKKSMTNKKKEGNKGWTISVYKSNKRHKIKFEFESYNVKQAELLVPTN